jgi:hypothetical protein
MTMSDTADLLGPVEFLVIEFPSGAVKGTGFTQLVGLVDAGHILVLDLEFIAKSDSGEVTVVEASTLGVVDGVNLEDFGGASSHLIDGEDVADAGALIAPGSIAAILVYEVLTVLPLIAAWEKAGASLVAAGAIEFEDLDAAITAAEARD